MEVHRTVDPTVRGSNPRIPIRPTTVTGRERSRAELFASPTDTDIAGSSEREARKGYSRQERQMAGSLRAEVLCLTPPVGGSVAGTITAGVV